MSLLTQFYGCDSGGGGANGGRFTGGSYPGSPTMLFAWDARSVDFADVSWSGSSALTYQGSGGFSNPMWTTYKINTATGVYVPRLLTVGTDIGATLSIPKSLYIAGVNFGVSGAFTFNAAAALEVSGINGSGGQTWNFGSATTIVNGGYTLTSAQTFSINAPNLVTLTNFYWSGYQTGAGNVINITNAQLDLASVEDILISIASIETLTPAAGGSIDLSGGGSAGAGALSPAGTAAVSTLTSNGWAVTLNL